MSDNSKISWQERVNMLSIHPYAARRHDIAKMAAELQGYWTAEIVEKNHLERKIEARQGS